MTGSLGRLLRPEKSLNIFRAGRATEVKTLGLVAGVVAQEVFLGFGFHAFGHYGQAQGFAHGDDRFGDGPVFAAGGDVADEGAVHFQGVDGEAFDLGQR